MSTVPPDDRTGRYVHLGKYEVLEHIATGGMGTVYKALDPERDQVVALKILPPELAAQPDKLERFRNEARQGMRLEHPNIARILDFCEAGGTYFLVLEFVEGIDLHRYLEEKKRLAPKESCRFILHAARALDHMHQHGLIHRDIKPANLLLAPERGKLVARLTDMGLAREVNDQELRLTKDGTTVGTVDYMAPEQARSSRAADIRSDLYSLGCTWYHMLAGQPPFADGSLVERLLKQVEAEPPDLRRINPEVPDTILAILGRLLAKEPAERYQTPAELLDDLDRLKKKRKIRREETREPASPPPPPPVPGEKRRVAPPTAPELPQLKDPSSATQEILSVDEPALLQGLTPDQQRAAAGQFDRAREVLADNHFDYAIHLLLSSCKLDPANLVYRKTLRQTEKAKYGNRGRGQRFRWLTTLPARTRLKSAKRNGQHARVLEHGEEVLVHDPWDLGVQMEMAEAAEALTLTNLATWLLEEAQDQHDQDPDLNRALASLYEKHGKFTQAIATWEVVRRLDPADSEAAQKITNLSARATIGRLRGR